MNITADTFSEGQAEYASAETLMQHDLNEPRGPELAEMVIADPADSWRALGFNVDDEDHLDLGAVRIKLGASGTGIVSWSFNRVDAIGQIDGLNTPSPTILRPPPFETHPNGATGLDQVVVLTGDFDRTIGAFERAGMQMRRRAQVGGRQLGLRRAGPAIIEVVHSPQIGADESRFWGVAVVVVSLEALAERLGDHLGPIRQAVQPGRRIATLNESAGLSARLAFLSPEL